MANDIPEEQLNATLKDIFQQSDRASAIVSSAMIEEILERLLLSFLMEHKQVKKDLFEGIAPISTLSAKNYLAYYLGLLTQIEFEDIKLIKAIRNEFAHTMTNIDFETPSIKNKCLQLKTLNNTPNPPEDIQKLRSLVSTKILFKINVTFLAENLNRKISKIKHITPDGFK